MGLISANPSLHFYISVIPNIRGKPYSCEEAPALGLFVQIKPGDSARSPPRSPHFHCCANMRNKEVPPLREEDRRYSELHQTHTSRKSTNFKRNAEILGGKRSLKKFNQNARAVCYMPGNKKIKHFEEKKINHRLVI